MPAGLEFCLLGPLTVRCDGVTVPVPPGKQRALLAVLLLRAGRPVTAEQLAELLWAPTAPPPSAIVTVRNYVKRLRQALGAAGSDRIVTQPGGYLMRVDDGELDIARMEHELTAARHASRVADWPQASRHAAAAIGMWRGEPLCDVDLPMLGEHEVPRLTELRLEAHELRIEADLRLGGHAEVVAGLHQLAVANPLREHLHALLMLALYRCGRRAEALEAYRRARDVLVDEIGGDPGPELQTLHRQILHDDPALALPPSPAPPAGDPAGPLGQGPPRQLPAAVRCFTGRELELATLTVLATTQTAQVAPTVLITAIGGTAGVGKTALAVQWAHQAAQWLPDGQLYVNLRGYDPGEPVSAADALAGFLRALGVPGTEIPDEAEERARLYRSRLAGRRMLVLLDNARDGDQVRPLLPGDPGCVAVVTSRDALAGLVATDGARRLDLDVLPLADAVALLRSLIGGRADDDRESAVELAGLCARLPLALRIAAELAAARRAAPLAALVAELKADRLDGLDAGEDRANVRAVFSWSFRQLPGDAAQAFALISLHPGQDLDVYASAALTGTTAGQARRVLSRLHRASLLQAAGPGRYGMHDLLRAYAREQAAALDTGGLRQQALTRLFDHYLAAAAAAMDVLFLAEAYQRPRITPTAAAVPEMPGQADARAWLDAERANMVAVVVDCAVHGWRQDASDLANMLFRYLMTGSHLPEAHTIYSHALRAARRSANPAAEAGALNGLGSIGLIRGHFRDAADHYRAALERYRQCGDRAAEARVLQNLGLIECQLYNHRSEAGYYRDAMVAFEDAGDSVGAARALAFLGGAETELGSCTQASRHLRRALQALREAKDQVYEAEALTRIGDLSLRRGQLTQAADVYEQALTLYRRLDNLGGVAAQICGLGEVSVRRGEYQRAVDYLRQALAGFRQIGSQYGETRTLLVLAEALNGDGHPAAARAELETALQLATETGNTYQQASAHRDLAESYHSAGEDEQARHHWQQALTLYTQLGASEADQVQSRLSAQQATVQQ